MSDAVVALDLKSGRIVWSKQFTTGDVFSGACPSKSTSCPDGPGPDFDFAASTILTTRPGGGDVLLAGQKSGIVFALDPDKKGDVLWQARVGKGGTSGGIQWGMSVDGQRVYAAVSDMDRTFQNRPLDPQRFVVERGVGGGITALNLANGTKVWSVMPPPCASDAPAGCNPAQSAAVTAVPGFVFSPSNDGHVRAYASADGKVLWDFNTMREFDTVNGVKARGGSIDGPGVVVAGGMVFVTSGYSRNVAATASDSGFQAAWHDERRGSYQIYYSTYPVAVVVPAATPLLKRPRHPAPDPPTAPAPTPRPRSRGPAHARRVPGRRS